MALVVTGTPGTGKTTFAKRIAQEKGYEYVDINEFARRIGAVLERDAARDTDVVDDEKVVLELTGTIKRQPNLVVDGHFSHELPPTAVEKCYVTKCDLAELKRRLEARGYGEEKIKENLEAEIFDTCRVEAEERGHDVEVVWTSAKPL